MKFFTSDCHFGHDAIAKLRGFEDSSIHDETLLGLINYYVRRNDILFILGDFAWTKPGKYRQMIDCKTVYLIAGNHDKVQASKRVFGGNFRETMMVKIRDQRAWLSHYPHTYWPSSHHGSLHLYGHMHSEYEWVMDYNAPSRRAMDVCPDNACKLLGSPCPFSEDFVYTYLTARVGHHHCK